MWRHSTSLRSCCSSAAAGKHRLPGAYNSLHILLRASGRYAELARTCHASPPCALTASLAVCLICLPHPLCLCHRGRAKTASIVELRRPDRGYIWNDTVTLRVGVRTATPPPPQLRQQQASPVLAPPLLQAPPTGPPQQLGAAA